MNPDIISRLVETGLSDKEARVYVAMLELGPEGAGEIAKRAAVNRATTYLALTSLSEHGLATSYDDGKQTLFVAETPRRLADLVERQKSEAEKKQDRATSLLPELEALFRTGSKKPVVRFYEGLNGLAHLRDYLRAQRAARFDSFVRLDERLADVARHDEERRLDLGGPHTRIIYVPSVRVSVPAFRPDDLGSRVKVKFAHQIPFEFDGEIGILERSAYLATLTPDVHVCVVESEGLARLLRTQFELAWAVASESRIDFEPMK